MASAPQPGSGYRVGTVKKCQSNDARSICSHLQQPAAPCRLRRAGCSGRRPLDPGHAYPHHPHDPLCRDPGVTRPLPGMEFPYMFTTSNRLRPLVATGAIATTVALVLAGCGARAGDDQPSGASAKPSCVDTSGTDIKL